MNEDVWEPLRRTTVAGLLGRERIDTSDIAGIGAGIPRRAAPAACA